MLSVILIISATTGDSLKNRIEQQFIRPIRLRTMLRSNFEKMRMGLRSGKVTYRDVPFYLWRNVRRLVRA